MTTDIKLIQTDNVYDIVFDDNGDIANGDFLDSILIYALFGEKRASESEVPIASMRRGWIGNEGKTFENGSKLWLFEQSNITRAVLNDIQSTALDALTYLIDDGYAVDIEASAVLQNNQVVLNILIYITQSKVETRFFVLWQNTGSN
ncbi:MAG: phage GP46 family protein [Gammaproteobacteria bacterium]|nr:phage GP46 family protein [Gammaproteobacteria bacterium]